MSGGESRQPEAPKLSSFRQSSFPYLVDLIGARAMSSVGNMFVEIEVVPYENYPMHYCFPTKVIMQKTSTHSSALCFCTFIYAL